MLHQGDKLRFYLKGTTKLYGELTIRKTEPTTERFFKVWFEEPAGEGAESRKLTAVDRDGKEYEVSSGWKDSRDSWGYILRPL